MRLSVVFLTCILPLAAHCGQLDDLVDKMGPATPDIRGGSYFAEPYFGSLFAELKEEQQREIVKEAIKRFKDDKDAKAGNNKKYSIQKALVKILFKEAPADLHKDILLVVPPIAPYFPRLKKDGTPYDWDRLIFLIEEKKISVKTLEEAAKESEDKYLRYYYSGILKHLKNPK